MPEIKEKAARSEKRSVKIEFLYLDLKVCRRCRATAASLRRAVKALQAVLKPTAMKVSVRSVHVRRESQAAELGFRVSPTIRVNGNDIQLHCKESPCESCGTQCGKEWTVTCREWYYGGRWYTEPPAGLIIEAVLAQLYGNPPAAAAAPPVHGRVPENLRRVLDCGTARRKPGCC